MLTHHNWWSTHYECYAALCQKWGCSAGSTAILTNREVRDPLRKKTALSGGKTEKNLSQFFLRLANTYKKYILQKNWVKTVIPALSSGQSNLPPSYMGSQPPTRWSTQKYKYEWQRSSSWAINYVALGLLSKPILIRYDKGAPDQV